MTTLIKLDFLLFNHFTLTKSTSFIQAKLAFLHSHHELSHLHYHFLFGFYHLLIVKIQLQNFSSYLISLLFSQHNFFRILVLFHRLHICIFTFLNFFLLLWQFLFFFLFFSLLLYLFFFHFFFFFFLHFYFKVVNDHRNFHYILPDIFLMISNESEIRELKLICHCRQISLSIETQFYKDKFQIHLM